jgi:hypothetical protein
MRREVGLRVVRGLGLRGVGKARGRGRQGSADERPATCGGRDVVAWARPAQNDFAEHTFEKENSNFFE